MSSDWNVYNLREPDPIAEGPVPAVEPLSGSDLLAAENPIGVTAEQCERHRLAYLRALLAEVRGRGA